MKVDLIDTNTDNIWSGPTYKIIVVTSFNCHSCINSMVSDHSITPWHMSMYITRPLLNKGCTRLHIRVTNTCTNSPSLYICFSFDLEIPASSWKSRKTSLCMEMNSSLVEARYGGQFAMCSHYIDLHWVHSLFSLWSTLHNKTRIWTTYHNIVCYEKSSICPWTSVRSLYDLRRL